METAESAPAEDPPRRLDPLIVGSWCLYDFGQTVFSILVITFIYAPFFARVIANPEGLEDNPAGTSLWSWTMAGSAIVIALLSPVLGALADRGGLRKRLLGLTTGGCIAFTLLLWLPQRGDIALAMALVFVANVCFELTQVFYNAWLTDIAPPEKVGFVSGLGWTAGYLGGLLPLFLALTLLVLPDPPLFGLDAASFAPLRATNILVALWFLVFALPLFAFVPESEPSEGAAPPLGIVIRESFGRFAATFREVRGYPQVTRFLIARLIFNDGLVTIFFFGGIYAQQVFGFTEEGLLQFGVLLNVTAAAGALSFGILDDRLGGKATILLSLAGLILCAIVGLAATSQLAFWVAGAFIGLFSAPAQSAARSFMGRMVPTSKETEFFGFFAFSGKATAFVGPALLGLVTAATGSQRAGFSVVILLLLVGGALLWTVDEQEGIRQARGPASPQPM